MNILLDNIIYSNVPQGGVSNYWFELSKYLLDKNQDTISFYEEVTDQTNFHRQLLGIPQNQIIESKNNFRSTIARRMSAVKFKTESHFLYHSSYYRPLTGTKNYSEVTTIHDFTHNYHSNLLKKIVHNKLKYGAIKRSKGIICISENTYKDLLKFCPPKKNQKITIIHNGVSDDYFPIVNPKQLHSEYLKANRICAPFLLYVGSRAKYKNFSFVLALLKEMPSLQLVIVGNDLTEDELIGLDISVTQRCIVLKNIVNKELNILYNCAHAFIYPSSYEGFGIPIIEAMRAGCPVLTLNNSSITEIAGDAGILFELLDLKSFKAEITKLFKNDFRDEIIARGFNQSSLFSWEKCSKETYEFYQENY